MDCPDDDDDDTAVFRPIRVARYENESSTGTVTRQFETSPVPPEIVLRRVRVRGFTRGTIFVRSARTSSNNAKQIRVRLQQLCSRVETAIFFLHFTLD